MRVLLTDLDGVTVERGVSGGRWTDEASGPTLDLSRLVCLPGLADAHSHLSTDDMSLLGPGVPEEIAARAFAVVEAGVFLVFDKGWSDSAVLSLTDVPPGRRPHFQSAGRVIAGKLGYYERFAYETDEDGLAEVVAKALGDTRGWVKIIGDWPRKGVGPVANFGESALRAAVSVAHEAGARVAVHTMAEDVPSMAVAAGVDSIEHGLFLTDDDIRSLGRRGGMWVPTVRQMEAVRDRFGPERTAGRVVGAGLDRVRSLLPSARSHGVRVLAGTDLVVPTASVATEAVRLVEYGMTSEDAVAAVCADAWAAAGLDASFRPGSPADVVAFSSDPREDVRVLLDPVTVMRAGVIHRSPG